MVEVRGFSNMPIVMLTAKAEEYDELKGFELGVNEYITKPFSPKILVAIIENILKQFNSIVDDLIEDNGIEIHKDSHIVLIDSKEVELSMKEFELLEYFILNKIQQTHFTILLPNFYISNLTKFLITFIYII